MADPVTNSINPILDVIFAKTPGFCSASELIGSIIIDSQTYEMMGSYDPEEKFFYFNPSIPIQEYGSELMTRLKDSTCIKYFSIGRAEAESHDLGYIKEIVREAKISKVGYFKGEERFTYDLENWKVDCLLLQSKMTGTLNRVQLELRQELVKLIIN